ncbi:hypothetical protein ACC735_39155, partial [Rhizobium ruizarguesonis]
MSKKLSSHHRRSALLAADAIVTFLHEAYLIELCPQRCEFIDNGIR